MFGPWPNRHRDHQTRRPRSHTSNRAARPRSRSTKPAAASGPPRRPRARSRFGCDQTRRRRSVGALAGMLARIRALANSTAALRRAAGELRVVMTENGTALTRATTQANRLTERIETMRRNGTIAEFNREYRQRRALAAANGRGYPSYSHMLTRLRRALIPVLASGDPRCGRNSDLWTSSRAEDEIKIRDGTSTASPSTFIPGPFPSVGRHEIRQPDGSVGRRIAAAILRPVRAIELVLPLRRLPATDHCLRRGAFALRMLFRSADTRKNFTRAYRADNARHFPKFRAWRPKPL